MLITTKLYIPAARAARVDRARLSARLTEGAALPLTLVAAPAGFGKTTLVAGWARELARPVAWVSLDEGDNDPARFWSYVISALQTVDARLGQGALAMLRSPQPPPPGAVTAALIGDLAATRGPILLVLDDYHLITARPVHDGMIDLLEHLPEQLRLVLLTRADPPFPLARLRARGHLAELRAADLRFTAAEASAFLHDVMGLALTPAEVATLESRTEGWAAALQLAALSLRGQGATARLVAGFTGQHHFVLDYVMEEVLRGQPAGIQEFLLQTSVPDQLCGPLCDAVTGRPGGQELLESLARENLFLVPLDDERQWYRYHRLFADVLKARLRRQCKELVPELHARAARWYEENGLPAEAVPQLLAAGDGARAALLIERLAIPMLMKGELTTLLAWLDALAPAQVAERPWLAVARSWALTLTGRPEAPAIATDDPLLRGHVAALRAYGAALRGDVPAAVALARESLGLLPADERIVRGVIGYLLGGMAFLGGNLEEAARAFAEAAAAAGESHLGISALSALGGVRSAQGRLREAAAIFRQAAASPLPAAGSALARLGDLHREWNDLETALAYVRKGLEQSRPGAPGEALSARHISLARICLAQGDAAAAEQELTAAERCLQGQPASPPVQADLQACRVQLWLARGDLRAAAAWAEQPAAGERAEIARARVLVALGRAAEALPVLAACAAAAEAGGRRGVVLEALLVQAVARHRTGDGAGARATLAKARQLAEPEGYVRIFLDEGPALAAISDPGAPGAAPAPGLLDPPSARELEILKLIEAGLSNEEIGARLFISPLTVKRHISNLYSKLGAGRRTQALAVARDLGLL